MTHSLYLTHQIGVDIDPSLIPKGNEAYKRVGNALHSADANEKLNALLQAQLTNFTNARDYAASLRKGLIACFVILLISSIFLLVLNKLNKIYPKMFFAIGRNRDVYERYQSQRQIWVVAIVIGFLINVIAGLIVTYATR
jgi:hypothetical protein